MMAKQFIVVGLGRFGISVAETLSELGHDVLAIDKDENVIQDIADKVTHAVQLDATDEYALRTLGVRNFDVAVVTIGSNIQASIMITLLLKEAGVKYVICKGQSELHKKVLLKIGADRVVLPEKDMGYRVAHNLVSSNLVDLIELSDDYQIIEMNAPDSWIGRTIKDLDVRANYGITVLALRSKTDDINISPTADVVIPPESVIIAVGTNEDLLHLEHTVLADED
ncbi:TrkA family potassium uptake protein [Proteiniclasticum sp. QWL-01]|uniref:potassium channel family protein n=1 Tax=Proteiniclasticum sp. QWL-01 TaxID=3036945 RepID=UPI0024114D73|nr:TrkA family potassium uptake protein [Proteiniclasticum sp. QWL-01]WFF74556.1 TrkA family potassium uptake protein [Proteiniclasticum sp. QWL-01]